MDSICSCLEQSIVLWKMMKSMWNYLAKS